MIKALNITKSFGKVKAVDSLSLKIDRGEIYAFLGPNGAGKTTTVKILTGIMKPDSGSVEILGMRMEDEEIEIKRRIGVVPEEPRIYPALRGWEFLNFVMKIFHKEDGETRKRLEELVDIFGMNYLNSFVSEMSHGMRQKLMVVSVLMRKPDVIFLDEPTVGLDPISTKALKELLRKYSSEGITIFLTTHVLEVAQDIADRVRIINEGKLIAEGSIEELRRLAGSGGDLEDLFIKLTGSEERLKEILRRL